MNRPFASRSLPLAALALLAGALLTTASGPVAVTKPSAPTPTEPPAVRGPLQGTFMFAGTPAAASIPLARMTDYFDELKQLGMTTLVIQAIRERTDKGCADGQFAWVAGFPKNLARILDEASEHGIEVYVGLTQSTPECKDPETGTNPDDVAYDTGYAINQIRKLGLLDHEALKGFYIPDEPGLGWPKLHAYYAGLVAAIRKATASTESIASAPILISPFLDKADARFSPLQVAEMALEFQKKTGVTIQIWQDSVGAGALDAGWDRLTGFGSLASYYAEISKAIGRDHFWANHELFAWTENPLNAEAVDRHATSVARLSLQLASAPDSVAARRVSWIQQRHLGTVDAKRDESAGRFKALYLARFGLSGRWLKPVSYRWLTPETASNPDDAMAPKLTDGKSGDPRASFDTSWVGVLGAAKLEVDLGSVQSIDWVALTVLQDPKLQIAFPKSLQIECGVGETPVSAPMTALGDFAVGPTAAAGRIQFAKSGGELVISNLAPLAAKCRWLRLTLLNAATMTTLVSELEIASGSFAPPKP